MARWQWVLYNSLKLRIQVMLVSKTLLDTVYSLHSIRQTGIACQSTIHLNFQQFFDSLTRQRWIIKMVGIISKNETVCLVYWQTAGTVCLVYCQTAATHHILAKSKIDINSTLLYRLSGLSTICRLSGLSIIK